MFYKSNPYPPTFIRIYDFSLKWILDRIPKNSRIIDIGCGDGYLTNILKAKCIPVEIIGIDKDYETLSRALTNNKSDIKYINIDGESKEDLIQLGQFDIILLRNTFHHFLNKEETLLFYKNILLKKNGKLLIVDLDSKANFDYFGLGSYVTLFYSLKYLTFSDFFEVLIKTRFLLKKDILHHRINDRRLLRIQKWLSFTDIYQNFFTIFQNHFTLRKQAIFLTLGGLYFFEFHNNN